MVTKVEPNLGHGISGWKARQESSRSRLRKSREERAEIREIRRQHRLSLENEAQAPEQDLEATTAGTTESSGVSETVAETVAETAKPVDLPDGVTGKGVEKVHRGGGWWGVYVDGIEVSNGNVRKERAEELVAEYSNERA